MGESSRSSGLSDSYGPLGAKVLEKISNDLFQEVCKNNTRLSKELRKRIESLSSDVRKEVVDRTRCNCSPLFVACSENNVELVEYLIIVCNADQEQRGTYVTEWYDTPRMHLYTPLCCACAVGDLQLVISLVQLGASVNAVADCGATPLLIACNRLSTSIVEYLVEHGADIQKPDNNGRTCLMASIRSVYLCGYLISHGANVHASNAQGKTALHYAVHSFHLETTELLLNYGADPFTKTNNGDDALQIACTEGAPAIFNYLLDNVNYSPERKADANELIGSIFVDFEFNRQGIVFHWQQALRIRQSESNFIRKRPEIPPRSALGNAVEFSTDAQLEEIVTNRDAMKVQALLIQERILGIDHEETLNRMVDQGGEYASFRRFQKCIDLWLLVLQVRIQRHSILHSTTAGVAQAIVCMMSTLLNDNDFEVPNDQGLPRFKDIAAAFQPLTSNVIETRQWLNIQPVSSRQQRNYDSAVQCLSHLIYMLFSTAENNDERELANSFVRHAIHSNIRSVKTNQTLLHLSLSRSNVIRSNYFVDIRSAMLPNANVVKLLLQLGADVNACDASKSTPLIIASEQSNYIKDVVRTLVEHGAHLDQSDRNGQRSSLLLERNPENDIPLLFSLKCISANAIVERGLPYREHLPESVWNFIRMHDSQ